MANHSGVVQMALCSAQNELLTLHSRVWEDKPPTNSKAKIYQWRHIACECDKNTTNPLHQAHKWTPRILETRWTRYDWHQRKTSSGRQDIHMQDYSGHLATQHIVQKIVDHATPKEVWQSVAQLLQQPNKRPNKNKTKYNSKLTESITITKYLLT